MQKAGQFFGRPTREGLSITTDAEGNTMVWYHKTF
jgi:hypothetical protein